MSWQMREAGGEKRAEFTDIAFQEIHFKRGIINNVKTYAKDILSVISTAVVEPDR